MAWIARRLAPLRSHQTCRSTAPTRAANRSSACQTSNLNTTPKFTLANEGNRPVFVDPTAIDPRTGRAHLARRGSFPQYGQVLSLNSNLQSDTRQVTASASGSLTAGSSIRSPTLFPRPRPVVVWRRLRRVRLQLAHDGR